MKYYPGDYECYVCEFNASNPPELNCPNCGSLQTLTELVTIRKSYLDDLQSELARLTAEVKWINALLVDPWQEYDGTLVLMGNLRTPPRVAERKKCK